MLSYCLKCRKNPESKNLKVAKTNKGKLIILSKCSVCDSKKSRYIKKQETRGLLISLRIGTPLSRINLVDFVLF